MNHPPVRIVQLSDLHLFANQKSELLGVNTAISYQAVVELLKKDSVIPQAILLTGDLSQDESEQAYLNLGKVIQQVKVPVYWIPGNHDSNQLLTSIFPQNNISNVKHILFDHWQIILLNSQREGRVEGYLSGEQLNFMQECLNRYPEHFAIIALHHQPLPVGSAWIDRMGLTNAEIFWETIKPHSQIKTILFGHVHQESDNQKNGVACYSVPSTCFQFKTNSEKFALENIPPGYRWLDLYKNGEMKTGIKRVSYYVGMFEEKISGY